MKPSSDKLQTPPPALKESSETQTHRSQGAKRVPVEPGPATQWPGPLDRPLGFSER